ncbi:hypothetical protein IGI04_001944 [Brassica rapa subsp. trilocularis]|uniref:Legume lectin domain-containing protein n=1 Tax=Brassica rapa subsp. trilocularis TaxID=1813537 RepID=A0ABQ7NU43_BRACM|nr:hypothetical protein IGI04_001944 [Brassica rapa subsp. trilocularis]
MIGSVNAIRFGTYVNSISGMDVTWDNINFRLSYSPLSRRFNDSTAFTELTETVNPMVPEQLSCSGFSTTTSY